MGEANAAPVLRGWRLLATPLAERVGARTDLRREGEIRAIGVSNATPEPIAYRHHGQLDADQENSNAGPRQWSGATLTKCAGAARRSHLRRGGAPRRSERQRRAGRVELAAITRAVDAWPACVRRGVRACSSTSHASRARLARGRGDARHRRRPVSLSTAPR